MGCIVSEGHGGRSQVDWSVVGHLHLEQDVSLGEEDDQHLVVARQVPVVLQDVSWTTRENCLKDSVIVSSIAIEELVFWKVILFDFHGCSFVPGKTEEGVGTVGPIKGMSRSRSRRGRESLAHTTEHSCPAGGLSRGQSQARGFAVQQVVH